MKSNIKKIAFVLFSVIIMAITVFASNAASEYKLVISSRSMNVGLRQTTEVSAVVEGLELQSEIQWSTSDETIATVTADGKVKGIELGSFDIIATTVVDGETLTAKFPMKVVKNENKFNS